jgi:hypothetical protein
MCSLHDVHDINAYRADHVSMTIQPRVYMIQLENCLTDFDEHWYGHHATVVNPKIIFLISLQL